MLQTDLAIRLKGVSKRFKLYDNVVSGPLKELFMRRRSSEFFREFVAVDDVTFDVARGEVVGVIGPNGAGKTTILKMIGGLLPIDEGSIEVNGKVNALLALGVGVNPEFTGLENILYTGLLLGMSREEIKRKMPSIVEFAELGEHIDYPFRTYSSGMRARLLFSTSMAVDPDILIVDEALSAGDKYFVEKCTRRIRELCEKGATILFVSHNMAQIKTLCSRALLMVDGRIIADGDPLTVEKEYNQWLFRNEAAAVPVADASGLVMNAGTGGVKLTDIRLKNERGDECKVFRTGDSLILELPYERRDSEIDRVQVSLGFFNSETETLVAEAYTRYYVDMARSELATDHPGIEIGDSGTLRVKIDPLCLFNNHYYVRVILTTPDGLVHYCRYDNAISFFAGVLECATRPKDLVCLLPVQEWTNE